MDIASCINTAMEIITNDRQNQYGTPEDNFRKIAALWTAYLGYPIDPTQVAVMMILLIKVTRQSTSPAYDDNYVDIVGDAACASEISEGLR